MRLIGFSFEGFEGWSPRRRATLEERDGGENEGPGLRSRPAHGAQPVSHTTSEATRWRGVEPRVLRAPVTWTPPQPVTARAKSGRVSLKSRRRKGPGGRDGAGPRWPRHRSRTRAHGRPRAS